MSINGLHFTSYLCIMAKITPETDRDYHIWKQNKSRQCQSVTLTERSKPHTILVVSYLHGTFTGCVVPECVQASKNGLPRTSANQPHTHIFDTTGILEKKIQHSISRKTHSLWCKWVLRVEPSLSTVFSLILVIVYSTELMQALNSKLWRCYNRIRHRDGKVLRHFNRDINEEKRTLVKWNCSGSSVDREMRRPRARYSARGLRW